MPDELHICARCGSDAERIECFACEDGGEAQPWCEECAGKHGQLVCTAPSEWCQEHHLIGREGVERGLIETLARESQMAHHVE